MKYILILAVAAVLAACGEGGSHVTESQLAQSDERSREADTTVRVIAPLEGEADKELASLVGLDEARGEVDALASFLQLQRQRQLEGKSAPQMEPHYMFTGPEGTGKLAVARILALLYRRFDIVGRGQVVEVSARRLLGQSQSETARLTNAVADSAREGLLLITDIDSMLVFPNPTYVTEAMLALLSRMQRDDVRMAVVLAGETEKIGRLLAGFPDLKSRFTRTIAFTPYTPDQLFSLFALRAQAQGLKIEGEGLEHISSLIAERAGSAAANTFEGAPYVRALYDRMLESQARRLSLIIGRTHADTCNVTTADTKACGR